MTGAANERFEPLLRHVQELGDQARVLAGLTLAPMRELFRATPLGCQV